MTHFNPNSNVLTEEISAAIQAAIKQLAPLGQSKADEES
jgi:hypothetical protein